MPTLSVVCSRNQKGSQRVRTESRPRLSGDTCPALFVCANTSGSCLSFLCASLRTEFRPKIKGSFLPNCTSASLRAVRIAKVVQVLNGFGAEKASLEQCVQKRVFNYKTDHLHLLCCSGEAEQEVLGQREDDPGKDDKGGTKFRVSTHVYSLKNDKDLNIRKCVCVCVCVCVCDGRC